MGATELNELPEVLRRLDEWRVQVPRQVARLRPFMSMEPGDPVLDVGAAQGPTVTAFIEHGFDAKGVEPSLEALEMRHALVEATGIETEIRQGVAEALPFDDESFQYVHLYSVMEHVDDPWQSLREAYRVLRPGGGVFFSSTSKLCPHQEEIRRFPLFPWYPDPVKRRIMDWAVKERPWLVGYTERPAYHWFGHRDVQRRFAEMGFARSVGSWEMRSAANESTGVRKQVIDLAAHNRAARLVGNLGLAQFEYLAVKPR
ncbi:MAG: hypothetical protein QOF76_2957 [Solirubrobacteraceae bacterium]|jgi:2-polyprenyl-6-hydroxyphenyl methylase/3-demethylubiquinone-9 3-methyltransferase|nr:hypothetical protein [Solirubrobacteraceae bacterium]